MNKEIKDKKEIKDETPPDLTGFMDIVAQLRAEDGCPWDREQTHSSLKRNLLEECYEVLDAIDEGSDIRLCDELGDVLLQVVFHAQIASEEGSFDMFDVIEGVKQKMIRRHPHVFADSSAHDSKEVLSQWEQIKAAEKASSGTKKHLMDLNFNLPSLLMAQKVGDKAARVGFDWESIDGVWKKTEEEMAELKEACLSEISPALREEKTREDEIRENHAMEDKIREEMGDLLFTLVNLSRFLNIDAEDALRGSTMKFINRFDYMEDTLQKAGKDWQEMTLSELNKIWDEAKAAKNQYIKRDEI